MEGGAKTLRRYTPNDPPYSSPQNRSPLYHSQTLRMIKETRVELLRVSAPTPFVYVLVMGKI